MVRSFTLLLLIRVQWEGNIVGWVSYLIYTSFISFIYYNAYYCQVKVLALHLSCTLHCRVGCYDIIRG